MKEEFKKKIINDLEKSGLGSQLIVLKIFQSLGWSAEYGTGYFDKDENKTREMDISAYHALNLEVNNKVCVYNFFHICTEVKKSEKPWIVFRSYLDQYSIICAWNNVMSFINLPVEPAKLTYYLSKNSLFSIKKWQGVGIHQAFKKPNAQSVWYSAFIAACKACEDAFENNKSDGNEVSTNILEEPTEFDFFQPLIVLDGVLLVAELSKSGEICIEEIDSAPFRFEFKTKNYNRQSYRVDVVTISGLKNYLEIVMQRQMDMNIGFKKSAPYAFG